MNNEYATISLYSPPLSYTPTFLDIPEADSSALKMILLPAVHDSTLPTDRTLAAALADLGSSTSSCSKMEPRKRTPSTASTEETYHKLLEVFRQRKTTLREAYSKIPDPGSRSNFYSQRYIVEMMIVDFHEYLNLHRQNPKTSLRNLNSACRERLGKSLWKERQKKVEEGGPADTLNFEFLDFE